MDTAREIVSAIGKQFGLTDSDIAARVKSSQPTIWRLRTGRSKDCGSRLYTALRRLHTELHGVDQGERKAAY